MKCTDHGADGCAGCRPALRAAWTVGAQGRPGRDSRRHAAGRECGDPGDSDCADEQVIVSAGFGTVDWGDGYGPSLTASSA